MHKPSCQCYIQLTIYSLLVRGFVAMPISIAHFRCYCMGVMGCNIIRADYFIISFVAMPISQAHFR